MQTTTTQAIAQAAQAAATTATHNYTMSRRAFTIGTGVSLAAAALALSGCSATSGALDIEGTSTTAEPTGDLAIDMAAWNYDADNDVYWQVGIAYCTSPQLTNYETMGLYVPGAYFSGTENSDGTYTCEVASSGSAGSYKASTAPIVIPVNTAGYAAQAAPTSYNYESVSTYLEEGIIYAYPGCRGRDNTESDDGSIAYAGGAPWGVTDLKAAIRCLRYNSAVLPGNYSAIFTFGHSGGGAQSSLVGATGDSELYTPYLEAIGAALEDSEGGTLSDAITGAMCWCPITCLEEADAAYEWQMGQFASTGTRAEDTFTAQLSADLAEAFAGRINELGLVQDGTELTLEESDEGIYMAGTYADALLAVLEESLNNFLSDTEFPYTPSSSTMADGGFGGGLTGSSDGEAPSGEALDSTDDELPSGEAPSDTDGEAPSDLDTSELPDDIDTSELPDNAEAPSGEAPSDSGSTASSDSDSESETDSDSDTDTDSDTSEDTELTLPEGEEPTDITDGQNGTPSESSADSTTYETAQDYIDSLNADEEWITYDSSANTATIASIGAFARICKAPTKDVGAFDALDLSQAENSVFGNGEEQGLHFDALLADLLSANAEAYAEYSDWDETYPEAYADDLTKTDSIGTTVEERTKLYNPLYYLLESGEGFGSSTPAPHWRIRTGIEQGDTAVTTEFNLALALEANENVSDVDFATVWGQGHTTAERTGSSDENFIAWIAECL